MRLNLFHIWMILTIVLRSYLTQNPIVEDFIGHSLNTIFISGLISRNLDSVSSPELSFPNISFSANPFYFTMFSLIFLSLLLEIKVIPVKLLTSDKVVILWVSPTYLLLSGTEILKQGTESIHLGYLPTELQTSSYPALIYNSYLRFTHQRHWKI